MVAIMRNDGEALTIHDVLHPFKHFIRHQRSEASALLQVPRSNDDPTGIDGIAEHVLETLGRELLSVLSRQSETGHIAQDACTTLCSLAVQFESLLHKRSAFGVGDEVWAVPSWADVQIAYRSLEREATLAYRLLHADSGALRVAVTEELVDEAVHFCNHLPGCRLIDFLHDGPEKYPDRTKLGDDFELVLHVPCEPAQVMDDHVSNRSGLSFDEREHLLKCGALDGTGRGSIIVEDFGNFDLPVRAPTATAAILHIHAQVLKLFPSRDAQVQKRDGRLFTKLAFLSHRSP